MSYEFYINECPKCGKYKHSNMFLINKIDKTLICLECAHALNPIEVQELVNDYLKQRRADFNER